MSREERLKAEAEERVRRKAAEKAERIRAEEERKAELEARQKAFFAKKAAEKEAKKAEEAARLERLRAIKSNAKAVLTVPSKPTSTPKNKKSVASTPAQAASSPTPAGDVPDARAEPDSPTFDLGTESSEATPEPAKVKRKRPSFRDWLKAKTGRTPNSKDSSDVASAPTPASPEEVNKSLSPATPEPVDMIVEEDRGSLANATVEIFAGPPPPTSPKESGQELVMSNEQDEEDVVAMLDGLREVLDSPPGSPTNKAQTDGDDAIIPPSKLATAKGKFELSNNTFELTESTIDARDEDNVPDASAFARVEALRAALETALGDDLLLKVYKLMRDNSDDADDNGGGVAEVLGPSKLAYYNTLVQLIVCEDELYPAA